MTTLIACLVSSPAHSQDIENVEQIIKREPSKVRSEKFYFPTSEDNGWFIHNAYREFRINDKISDCVAKETLAKSTPPVKTEQCPAAGPPILKKEPSRDKIEKEFFPSGPDNGWWVHNNFREEKINWALKQCEIYTKKIDECEHRDPPKAPELKAWQQPTNILWALTAVFVTGAAIGYGYAKQ